MGKDIGTNSKRRTKLEKCQICERELVPNETIRKEAILCTRCNELVRDSEDINDLIKRAYDKGYQDGRLDCL